jgi:hypothetical protein
MPRLETDLGAYIYSPFSPKKLFNGRACFNSFPRFKIFDRLLQYCSTAPTAPNVTAELLREQPAQKFNRGKTLKHARPLKKKNRRKRGIYYCPKNKTIQSKLKNRKN